MKFVLLSVCAVMLLSACVPPHHVIRVNESLPKNAPIENESIVVYTQKDSLNGKNSLTDNDVISSYYLTYNGDVRQIEFIRFGAMTCDSDKIREADRGYVYYVVWYKEGEPHREIKLFCDEPTHNFKVSLFDYNENQTKDLDVVGDSSEYEWVVEVK
jgi:hypothetical protein